MSLLLLPLLLLLLLASPITGQQWEFCYLLYGGAYPPFGGYGVSNHGYFYTNSSITPPGGRVVYNIYNSVSTRTVVSILGQTHVESLSGIVTTNDRVDDNLFLTSPVVDDSGIQLPIVGGSPNPTAGTGTMLAYDQPSQPFVFVTNTALNLLSQLNSNVNVRWSDSQYGERLDAGGVTITPASSAFYVQPYNPSSPMTNCTVSLTGPTCTNYPSVPPAGSVIFNLTLSTPWTALPSTYITDLLTALTVQLTAGTAFSSQSSYLGLYLFSCYPLFTATAPRTPRLFFYLNSQSVAAMGLSMSKVVPAVYAALQPGSTSLSLPIPSEQGLIAVQGCPFVYNGNGVGYAGVPGCSAPTVGNQGGGGGGSSSLSGGDIAGIVIGSVVGAVIVCLVCLFMLRMTMGGEGKQAGGSTKGSRFENEESTVRPTDTEATTVEMS